MKQTFRCLLTAVLLVSVAVGLEYAGAVDVPGLDVTELGLEPHATVERLGENGQDRPGPEPDPAAEAEADTPTIRLVSWNLYNFGRTKDDREISVAAKTLRDADLVAAQEIVTSPPGAQAIGKLDRALNRTGAAWDYRTSRPTTGPGTEKYAFLWKPSRLRLLGQAWLEASLADSLDREPYLARFKHRKSGRTLLVASLHAVPSSKDPGREVALLNRLDWQYKTDHVVLVGDFNLDEDDSAFDELRGLGYTAVLDNQPTSLRRKRRDGPDGHLASEYDNIFYETAPLRKLRGGVLDFTPRFSSLKEARSLSDHLPVYTDVQWARPSPALP
jgi:deoxyribonuclease-1-like protein